MGNVMNSNLTNEIVKSKEPAIAEVVESVMKNDIFPNEKYTKSYSPYYFRIFSAFPYCKFSP